MTSSSSQTPHRFLYVTVALLAAASVSHGQTIISRGFRQHGPVDTIATGGVTESLLVESLGECAVRTLHHNNAGFNFKRDPDGNGKHECQVLNTDVGCYSVNREGRTGWNYYFGGSNGQNEPTTSAVHRERVTSYGTSVGVLTPDDPSARWTVDCNTPALNVVKECSGNVLTGLHDNYAVFTDLDYLKCYGYGRRFSVSQEVAAIRPVVFAEKESDHECPPNHVITALSDSTSPSFSRAEYSKCNLLLNNWRVDYSQCTLLTMTGYGGGPTDPGSDWNIDTTWGQVEGVVAVWRVSTRWTGFKSCRLYRMA